MEIFLANRINPQAFDDAVRRATNDLQDVWAAAERTQSPAVESTHFLIALASVPGGATQKSLTRRGLSVDQWQTGLSGCAAQAPGVRPASLTQTSLDKSARDMFHAVRQKASEVGVVRVTEPLLLWAGVQHVTETVRELCQAADINLDEWREELESQLAPVEPLRVLTEQKSVLLDSFGPTAKQALRLLRSETEALGYARADPRHLLLALLALEGGVTHYGLHQQGVSPRKVQEAVTLNLRARARRTRSTVPLDQEHMQPSLLHMIVLAGQFAEQARALRVGEGHLLRALLAEESTARRLLADQKVDIPALRRTAEEDVLNEDDHEDDAALADIATVRTRLKSRLVGQDKAIEQILPYVEYMRFGLTTPGHPVGVFLFCGQSGSGKTEMAKELARAVYGSEDNLVFLEMGQFNAPESMNIFVGAPPGYIGYGEGKLTNGLRDKPRSVVLFDEVEKAHNKVLDALLRFLDEGKIDDPAGPVRDGSECIVILTSNVAADKLDDIWRRVADRPADEQRIEVRKQLRDEFRKHNFRIEFLNRVDEVLLFNSLKQEDYVEIARRFLRDYLAGLQDERLIAVEVDDGVSEAIGRYCAALNEGARSVPRVARTAVILPVVRHVLTNAVSPPVRLKVRSLPGGDGEPRTEVIRG